VHSDTASLPKDFYRSDPERVIQNFKRQPSLHSNPSALSDYVKDVVNLELLTRGSLPLFLRTQLKLLFPVNDI
jgi:hypothetical protein